MNECITDALVIGREESGEHDARVFLYTQTLGSVVAKATSIRKITSKLATHLQPLNFVKVRLIERANGGSAGYQIGDALLTYRANEWRASPEALIGALELLAVFRESGFRGDPDPDVWQTLVRMFQHPPAAPLSSYRARLLTVLGFDPLYAACGSCGAKHPAQFSFSALAFFCDRCFSLQHSQLPTSANHLAQATVFRLS